MTSSETTLAEVADADRTDDGAGEVADPAARPTRRTFTAEFRARVVAEYEAAPHGEKAAVLRREGLYQSQVAEWMAARDAAVAGRQYSRTSHRGTAKSKKNSAETVRLRKENERLSRELATSQAVVGIMGKLQGLLEHLSESTGTATRSTK